MKRFNDYTDAELLGLDNATFNDAVRLEAIARGVKPPIPLSEALRSSEWRGYQCPGDAAAVWEIMAPNQYSSATGSGIAYHTEERAQQALAGAVSIRYESYGKDIGFHFCQQEGWGIRKVSIGVSKATQAWAKFQEYTQDDTDFDKVVEECTARWSGVLQAAYDKKVRSERRTEYLRLAAGNEEIARAFWGKAERTEWPTE